MLRLIGMAIWLLGRVLISAGSIALQALRQAAQAALAWAKEMGIAVSEAALLEAVNFVLDYMLEVNDDLKAEIQKKTHQLVATGSPNPTAPRDAQYIRYYRVKVPYRTIISKVLCFANQFPIINALGHQQKQWAASILFDVADSALDWKSPIKSELWYSPSKEPLLEATPWRPKRPNGSHRGAGPKGYIAADITIVEDRHEKPEGKNIFALVEVKFPNDAVNQDQIDAYEYRFRGIALAIIRVPEDCGCKPIAPKRKAK